MSDERIPSPTPEPDCWGNTPKSPGATKATLIASGHGELVAKIGTVASAIMASSCCWLPPLLIVFGVSGAGMVAALEEYRPVMMVVTFSFLAAAFYFTYRPRSAKATDCCAESPQAVELSGSESAPVMPRKRRFNMMAMNKAMLWGVTVMAVVFLFFPQTIMSFFKPNDDITADMTSTVLKIEGMTCLGWEVKAATAIQSAPGVLAVKVDYPSGQATIGTAPGQSVPREEILTALESIRYKGEFVTEEKKQKRPTSKNQTSFQRPAILERFDANGNGKLDESEKRELRGSFGNIDVPMLPASTFDYTTVRLPAHVKKSELQSADNTPPDNPLTNHGATLGRVLFYDKQLSRNNTVACSSCHLQRAGFSDPKKRSQGFAGGQTGRNAMSLANVRYSNLQGHRPGFFWDERAATVEAQVLMPIQDEVEMGMSLPNLETRLSQLAYYPALFKAAFGSPKVTSDRVAKAVAQFMRAMIVMDARFDRAAPATRDYSSPFPKFTEEENLGKSMFFDGVDGVAEHGCAHCHVAPTFSMTKAFNNGLAMNYVDQGLGKLGRDSNDPFTPSNDGKFKAPSLRNIELTAPYMHDGRFTKLEQVVDHYSQGVQLHENLGLAFPGQETAKSPSGMKFTEKQKAGLIAFLKTLTDAKFAKDPKFSDPFVRIRKPKK